MTTILHIESSLFGADGKSSQLAKDFVRGLREREPGATVIERRLGDEPLPHLDAGTVVAWNTAAGERSREQQRLAALSAELIDELEQADVLVLGVPMYNFGIPSTLKAWIDQVARAGITFRYTEQGPVGLLENKKAYVFAARGGRYAGTDKDSQTPYLQTLLGFLGIDDVEFVYAEGLNMGDGSVEQKLAEAGAQGRRLLAA